MQENPIQEYCQLQRNVFILLTPPTPRLRYCISGIHSSIHSFIHSSFSIFFQSLNTDWFSIVHFVYESQRACLHSTWLVYTLSTLSSLIKIVNFVINDLQILFLVLHAIHFKPCIICQHHILLVTMIKIEKITWRQNSKILRFMNIVVFSFGSIFMNIVVFSYSSILPKGEKAQRHI